MFEGDEFVFHNYLDQQTFTANRTALDIVQHLRAWTERDALAGLLPGYSKDSIARSVDQLIELSAVVVEDSDTAAREEDFEASWLWGPWAAAYHFSTRGGNFMTGEAAEEMLRQQMKWNPSPSLFTLNGDAGLKSLPPPQNDYPEPYRTMAKRRTNRFMLDQPIPVRALLDSLLFSLAITATMEDPEAVDLPLKMTPSGGARNPYEATLSSGTWRVSIQASTTIQGWSGRSRRYRANIQLRSDPCWPVRIGRTPPARSSSSSPTSNVRWWKYHNASAYRVAMIVAGHIGQNIMLVATQHGLVANGSGAFSAKLLEEALGLTSLTQSVVYALILGVPDPSFGGSKQAALPA